MWAKSAIKRPWLKFWSLVSRTLGRPAPSVAYVFDESTPRRTWFVTPSTETRFLDNASALL